MFAHIYLLQYDLPARRLRVGWDLQQFDLSLTPSSSSVGSWSTRTGGSSELSRCWQHFVQEVKTWALSSSRFRRRLASTSSGSIPTWDLLGFILDKKIYLRPSGRLGNGISCNLFESRGKDYKWKASRPKRKNLQSDLTIPFPCWARQLASHGTSWEDPLSQKCNCV